MAFLSGLWWPLQYMPSSMQFIKDIAPVWPSYHLSQMALGVVGEQSHGSTLVHIAVLGSITVVFFVFAMRRLARGGK